jgi:uncharacterized protein
MPICAYLDKTKDKINEIAVSRKNKKMAKSFFSVPFAERMIFVPHCLRKTKACKAKEAGAYYVCEECGGCKIGQISRKGKELNYKGVFILKGGKILDKLIRDLKPKAVLGVACFFEGVQGIKQSEKNKVSVQFVPLTKDGCADTDTDLGEVFKVLEKIDRS